MRRCYFKAKLRITFKIQYGCRLEGLSGCLEGVNKSKKDLIAKVQFLTPIVMGRNLNWKFLYFILNVHIHGSRQLDS